MNETKTATNLGSEKKFIHKSEDGKLIVPEAKNECAFHINTVDNVCSDQFTLDKMKEFINGLDNASAPTKSTEIVEKAKKLTGCNTESCVIKSQEISGVLGREHTDKIIATRFKPAGPANSTAWLNNDNIDHTIHQWSKIYPKFLHIPFQMIDFDKNETHLAQVNLVDEYQRGMRRMGCVINTDKSTGSGIHWFCIYIDMTDDKKWTLEYFDSAGDYPKKSVHEWLNNQRALLSAAHAGQAIEVVDVTRSNQLQRSTTECGVFSLWYILSRLNGIPYSYFSQPNATDDKMMYKFREFLFRLEKKSGGKKTSKKTKK